MASLRALTGCESVLFDAEKFNIVKPSTNFANWYLDSWFAFAIQMYMNDYQYRLRNRFTKTITTRCSCWFFCVHEHLDAYVKSLLEIIHLSCIVFTQNWNNQLENFIMRFFAKHFKNNNFSECVRWTATEWEADTARTSINNCEIKWVKNKQIKIETPWNWNKTKNAELITLQAILICIPSYAITCHMSKRPHHTV